eukprot:CAMPEP_0195537430 /NCGR_PEP_ID=MMETSP0794_2-20130614/47905_1 /TAXON_ID=515487 /ORGANISM="Stephanopyxis turris, Strain CCMP 815" /LENGTH=592 /DNA_ID=CAMNT_0040671135 /DNA_START=110 /DNA_END=1885 /DNA_ORIENTATION=-
MEKSMKLLDKWYEDMENFNNRYARDADRDHPIHLPYQIDISQRLPPLMGKVDAIHGANLAKTFDLDGYPTLKLFLPVEDENDVDSTGWVYKVETGNNKEQIYSVLDYDANILGVYTPESLLDFIMHDWTRVPSPVFAIPTAESLSMFINWVEDDNLSTVPNKHGFVADRDEINGGYYQRRDESGAVVFVQCQYQEYQETEQGLDETEQDDLLEFDRLAYKYSERMDLFFVVLLTYSLNECEELGMTASGQTRVILAANNHNREEKDWNDSLKQDQRHLMYTPAAAGNSNTTVTMEEFIHHHSLPLLTWFHRDKTSIVFSPNRKVHISLYIQDEQYESNNHTLTDIALSAMKQAAMDYRHSPFVFLVIPSSEQKIVRSFEIPSFPSVLITDMRPHPSFTKVQAMRKYLLSSEQISKHNSTSSPSSVITDFVATFVHSKLKPRLRTQPIQPTDADGLVKTIRGSSFQSMVMQSQKHIVVNFFAPWCGHSKRLTPKWVELAQLVRRELGNWGQDNVEIMKMDASQNEVDHPMVDIVSFPMIYLFPKNNKTNPVRFDWISHHHHPDENSGSVTGATLLTGNEDFCPNQFLAWVLMH